MAERWQLTTNKALQYSILCRFAAVLLGSILFARLTDATVIGQFESLALITTSFSFFWVTGMVNAYVPMYFASPQPEREKITANVTFAAILLSVLTIFILAILKFLLWKDQSLAYWLWLCYGLFNFPAFLVDYALLTSNRSRALMIYGTLSALAYVSAIWIPLHFGFGLTGITAALAIVAFLRFTALAAFTRPFRRSLINAGILKQILIKSWPLMIVLILSGSIPYVDAYIARHFFSLSNFAVYQYGARELPLLVMATTLSTVLSGNIAGISGGPDLSKGLQAIRSQSKRLMHFLFPAGILLMAFSHLLFVKIYSPAFSFSAHIFNVYLLLIISRMLYPQSIISGLQTNEVLARISGIEWVVNLVLDFLFLYFFGLIGIAYATILSYFIERILLVGWLAKRGISFSQYTPVRAWSLYSLALITTFIIVEFVVK